VIKVTQTLVVLKKDLRGIIKSKGFWLNLVIFLGVFGMLAKNYVGLFEATLSHQEFPEAALISQVGSSLDRLLYFLSFSIMMWMSFLGAGISVTMEKVKRTLESLLATPLGIGRIWGAKVLAMFLPALAAGYLVIGGLLLWFNLAVIVPQIGGFVLPGAISLLILLVIVPMVVLLIDAGYSLLQFVLGSFRLVSALFMGAVFGMTFGSWSLIGSVDVGTLKFLGVNLGIMAVVAGVVLILGRLLTPERVVLTSKGE